MELAGPGKPLLIYRNFHHTNDYYTDYTCTQSIPNPQEIQLRLKNYENSAYLLTKATRVGDLAELHDWSYETVFHSGRSVLVKLTKQR